MDTLHGHLASPLIPPSLKPRFREISSPISWAICFLTYVAVRTQDPTTRGHLVYAQLVLQEALCHGGSGWLDYDRLFRKQAALDQLLPWDSIHPALHSSLILGQRKSSALFCTLYKGVDHLATHCTLVPLQPPPAYPSQVGLRAHPIQFDSHRRPSGPPKRSGLPRSICLSWNRGSCSFPATCSYRHVCITCQAEHQAKNCPHVPVDPSHNQLPAKPVSSRP